MSERVKVQVKGLGLLVEVGEIQGGAGTYVTMTGPQAGALGLLLDPLGEYNWESLAVVRMDAPGPTAYVQLDDRLAGLHDLVEALLAARSEAVLGG